MSRLNYKSPNSAPSGKLKFFTVVALVLAILGLLISIVPFFGSSAVVFGLLGFIIGLLVYYQRSKQGFKKQWAIAGLILSVCAFASGFNNYLNHKNAVDLLLGVPGAKSKLLLVPEDSPIREIVERGSGYTEAEINERKSRSAEKESGNQSDELSVVTSTSKDTIQTMYEKKTSGPLKSYYYSVVDKLRVRSKPETGSEVLGHLQFGEQVRWYGEKSEEMEKIVIAGKERNDYWYKIKSMKYFETEGWVYGGALLNATVTSTNRLIDRTVKPYNFISNDSLTALIGRSGYGTNFIYSGLMTYRLDESNNLNSHGRFFFNGFSRSDFPSIPGYGEEETLGGMTKDGKLDGEFTSLVGLFESWIDLNIKFEEGNCLSYEMVENQEGEKYESKSSDPEDCSFDAIQGKLKYIN